MRLDSRPLGVIAGKDLAGCFGYFLSLIVSAMTEIALKLLFIAFAIPIAYWLATDKDSNVDTRTTSRNDAAG